MNEGIASHRPAGGTDTATSSPHGSDQARITARSLLALGVVYGDIGTSPLYALRECFIGAAPTPITHANVLGVLSLIFWALILVISVKYLLFVMRADNRGEGGILALLALLDRRNPSRSWLLLAVAVFGAALLYGDGVITPAISVLSATEGLEVLAPGMARLVIPATIAILCLLFLLQKHGTSRVGAAFGPVMLLWFGTLTALGIGGILAQPRVLAAIDPAYAAGFLMHRGVDGYLVLGAVFLVVTGGEALYADMGHLGRAPIRLAWFTVVLPGLLLNYFGQGAYILAHPEDASHPFYALVPSWGVAPMIGLAAVATVIASQAVISGAFSLTRQAVQLGMSPPITIRQTSSAEIGQIYVPLVNWLLLLAAVLLVVSFGSSGDLAGAYGIAVSTTMVITTGLTLLVATRCWHWSWLVAGVLTAAFLAVDIGFFGANLLKIWQGGWIPLAIAGVVLTMFVTWPKGRKVLSRKLGDGSLPVDLFIPSLTGPNAPRRIPGIGVFLTSPGPGVPRSMLHHLKLNRVLNETVILLTAITEEVPRIASRDRVEVTPLGGGLFRVTAHYGFMESPDIPHALRLCWVRGLIPAITPETTTYYLGRATLVPSRRAPDMPRWQRALFMFMARNAQRATIYYNLPPGRTIELGIQVDI